MVGGLKKSEVTVDLKKSGTLFLRMASVRIAHMTRDEVMERLEHLGWNQLRTWNTRFSKRRASCENSRTGDAKSETNDTPNVCRGLSQKNKTELRDVCKALSIPLSGHETKPQLTKKIKEVQAEREALRQATLGFGRHQWKTQEWVGAHDKQHCEWAVLTVVEDGATASPQLKEFASHVDLLRGTSPRVTSSPRRKLHSETTKLNPEEELADLMKRVEHLQAMVQQRKTRAKFSTTRRR